jgi:hypothetical protein
MSKYDTTDNILNKLDKITKMISAPHYKYYNANPMNHRTTDCVIRSISTALNKSWDDVLRELTDYSLKYKYFINAVELYEIYLKDNGWKKHSAPHKSNGDEYSLLEWLHEFDKEAIVTIEDNHLTYVNHGCVYDIWNCSDMVVNEFWTMR